MTVLSFISMDFKQAADRLRKQGHKIFTMTGDKGFIVTVDDSYTYTAQQLIFLVANSLQPTRSAVSLWTECVSAFLIWM
jgi:hypothetical protein